MTTHAEPATPLPSTQVPTTPPAALRARTVSGVRLTLMSQAAVAIAQVGYSAVAARILTDADFGVTAAVLILLRFVQQFANLGMGAAIVQAPQVSRTQARAAHSFATYLGAGLALAVVAASPVLEPLLPPHPEAGEVLLLLALAPALSGLTAVPVGLLRRRHGFRAMAVIDVVSYFVGFPFVGLLCAVGGLGPVSLALAALTQGTVAVTLSLVMVRDTLHPVPGSPRGSRRLASFGSGVSVISFLEFWSSSLDTFVVSRTLGAGLTGQYTRASYLVWLPAQQLGTALNRVMVSTTARFAEGRVATQLKDGLEFLAAVLLPGLGFAAVVADPLVRLMLGPQWGVAAQLLPLMCLAAGVNTLNALLGVTFEARGLLRQKVVATTVKLGVLGLALAAAIAWAGADLRAYAWAWIAAEITRHVGYLVFSRRLGLMAGEVLRGYTRALATTAWSLGPAAAVAWLVTPTSTPASGSLATSAEAVAVPAVVLLAALAGLVLWAPRSSVARAVRVVAPGALARWARSVDTGRPGAPASVPAMAVPSPEAPGSDFDRAARVSVVMATYNRVAVTEGCLQALRESASACPGLSWDVVLVDSSSPDGTADRVRALNLDVTVVSVPATWYWAQAMRRGMDVALSRDPDVILWLNDDVRLQPTALSRLLAAGAAEPSAVLVGSTCDAEGSTCTYGGLHRPWRGRPLAFERLPVGVAMTPAETMNGNVVALPRSVYRRVGMIRGIYRHQMADIDYGLRVRRAGFSVLVLPGFLGTCADNTLAGTWRDTSMPRALRLAHLLSPKGLPPRSWWFFCLRWGGPLGAAVAARPYLSVVLGRRWR